MFIRRKRNKSGSVSVQLVSKAGGRYRVLASVGTGWTEQELLHLERRARVQMARYESLPLFADYGLENDLDRLMEMISNSQVNVIGPELIFGALYDHIGYNVVDNGLFRDLVVSRLFHPGSKLKTVDYLRRYHNISRSASSVYRFLDRLCERDGGVDVKESIERVTYDHTLKVLGGVISVAFYDLTTLYFEASDEDDLRRCGFSKDGKHSNPQVLLALLTAAGGNPIGYEVFEGNIFEGDTFIPVISRLSERFGFGRPVVIADAGLLSRKNIKSLSDAGYTYILGARLRNESQRVKQAIMELNLDYGQTGVINRGDGTRLVISKSLKRAKKDLANRKRGMAKLVKRVHSGRLTKEHLNNRGYNRYLKLEGQTSVSIDMERFEQDAAWDGIKGYLTNTDLSDNEVIANYSSLWMIERAFRMNKTDLEMRPIYHHLRNRIEGHICICFTAYTIMLELERALASAGSTITVNRAMELVKNMYQLTYVHHDSMRQRSILLKMDPEQQELYNIITNHCHP